MQRSNLPFLAKIINIINMLTVQWKHNEVGTSFVWLLMLLLMFLHHWHLLIENYGFRAFPLPWCDPYVIESHETKSYSESFSYTIFSPNFQRGPSHNRLSSQPVQNNAAEVPHLDFPLLNAEIVMLMSLRNFQCSGVTRNNLYSALNRIDSRPLNDYPCLFMISDQELWERNKSVLALGTTAQIQLIEAWTNLKAEEFQPETCTVYITYWCRPRAPRTAASRRLRARHKEPETESLRRRETEKERQRERETDRDRKTE